MRIGCLHTAESNVAVFDTAAKQLIGNPPSLNHQVRSDLLLAAEQANGLTPAIAAQTKSALLALCEGHDAVILTCSTLGPSVEGLNSITSVPILRVDEALARRAVMNGGKVVVLCAVETTLGPTTQIFRGAAIGTKAIVEVQLVHGAWAKFKVGEREGYLSAIAEAADNAYDRGAHVVALAQASMTEASDLVRRGPKPLTSPAIGVLAAMNAIAIRINA